LCRLIEEGHTPISAGIVMGRTPRALANKATSIGKPFGKGVGKSGTHVQFNLGAEEYRVLRNCAGEIQIHPNRLARIIINIVAQKNLWAQLLHLSDADGDYLIHDDDHEEGGQSDVPEI
jgi:hypothetical protein